MEFKKMRIEHKRYFYIHLIAVLCIAAFIFTAYSSSLHNDFIWDDEFLIKNNVYIKSFSHCLDIFKTCLASSSGNLSAFYRPIQELSYMVDYFLWGNDPFGFHLTNVILHCLCAIAVYILSLAILKNILAAFTTAAIFGVHPINTEAVTYIAGRADSLYLFFFLASFILFLKSSTSAESGATGKLKIIFYILSLFSYVLSIFSKEMGLILPLMIFLYVMALPSDAGTRRRLLRLLAPFICVAMLYIIARKTALDFSKISPPFVMGEFNIFVRLLTTFKVICVYLSLLAAPLGLHMERRIAIAGSIAEPQTQAAAFAVLLLVVIVWKFRLSSRRSFFAGMWFFVGLLPISNIVPINSFIAEHWLYLPAIGVYMLVGIALSNIFYQESRRWISILLKAAVVMIVFAILLFFGALTFTRNKDWKDEITFFKNTIKYSPNIARLRLMLGKAYSDDNQLNEAMAEYMKVIELQPNHAKAYGNIGSLYRNMGNHAEAKEYLKKALLLDPTLVPALSCLGYIYEEEGNINEAERLYSETVKIMPSNVWCRMRLGHIYINRGQTEIALSQWREIMRIAPSSEEAKHLINEYSK